MNTRVLLLGCLLVVTSEAQTRREVWQWRDENGVTHFSDFPQPGARITVGEWVFEVQTLEGRRIDQVRAFKEPQA